MPTNQTCLRIMISYTLTVIYSPRIEFKQVLKTKLNKIKLTCINLNTCLPIKYFTKVTISPSPCLTMLVVCIRRITWNMTFYQHDPTTYSNVNCLQLSRPNHPLNHVPWGGVEKEGEQCGKQQEHNRFDDNPFVVVPEYVADWPQWVKKPHKRRIWPTETQKHAMVQWFTGRWHSMLSQSISEFAGTMMLVKTALIRVSHCILGHVSCRLQLSHIYEDVSSSALIL